MKTLTSFQVAKAIGEKYPRLRGWLDVKAITPSIQAADGIGSKALFSQEDVYFIGLFKECLALGFSREEASSAVQDVKSYYNGVKQKYFDCLDLFQHILFVKRNGTFLNVVESGAVDPNPKPNKSFSEAVKATLELPVRTIILDREMFEKYSIKDLIARHGTPGAYDYDSLAIINFGKIIRGIDSNLK